MNRFYFRNFIIISALMMLSFIILGAGFIGVGQSIMLRERHEALKSDAVEISKLASAHAQGGNIGDWELRITLSAISQSTGNQCVICNENGVVISCSDMDFNCAHLGKTASKEAVKAAASPEGYSGVSTLGKVYDSRIYVCGRPIYGGGEEIIGYAFVSSNSTSIIAVWHLIMNLFLIMAVAILIMALIICFLTAKKMSRPINDMAEAALKYAHGDFSARVAVNSQDEIGALGAAFNQMAESLEKSERRRNEFLANVSHELKTPMTTISGFADGILDGTIPRENERKYLETISSETKRLNRLVRRMLEITRAAQAGPEELRKKSFDAGELLLQTLLVFERKIEQKHLEVNLMLPEDSMIVCGDSDLINQVMYNLIENAVKFAPDGSELGVSLFKQEDKAYVSIKNQGDTIPAEELDLIFERFHKTDKSRSVDRDGVGLGLYIVKNILNNHGEDVAVTSKNGVTEFVFSLTLKKEK